MGWVKYEKGLFPPEVGEYFVIEYIPGIKDLAFFKGSPPRKEISLMDYKQTMKLENEYVDRCVYVKYKTFFNKYGQEKSNEEILYWYQLDPIPEITDEPSESN